MFTEEALNELFDQIPDVLDASSIYAVTLCVADNSFTVVVHKSWCCAAENFAEIICLVGVTTANDLFYISDLLMVCNDSIGVREDWA